MTAANKAALDLHPAPAKWEAGKGYPNGYEQTDEDRFALGLRTSIACDDLPFQVRMFRQLMHLTIPTAPTPLSPQDKQLQTALLLSELSEFAAADGLVEQADGLIDILYVAMGALINLGLSNAQIVAGLAEVHQSNLTKVQDNGRALVNDGQMDPSQPIGKVLKTANYVKPDLAAAMSIKE